MFKRALLAGIVGAIGVAHAYADPAPLTVDDFKGRWVSARTKLTLDVSPCGEGVCGIIVTDNTCGHTALRVGKEGMDLNKIMRRPSGYVILEGKLELAAGSLPYGVQATLSRDEAGVQRIFIAGHKGGTFSPIRRMYDYNDLMVRAGDSHCAPAAKTS